MRRNGPACVARSGTLDATAPDNADPRCEREVGPACGILIRTRDLRQTGAGKRADQPRPFSPSNAPQARLFIGRWGQGPKPRSGPSRAAALRPATNERTIIG